MMAQLYVLDDEKNAIFSYFSLEAKCEFSWIEFLFLDIFEKKNTQALSKNVRHQTRIIKQR